MGTPLELVVSAQKTPSFENRQGELSFGLGVQNERKKGQFDRVRGLKQNILLDRK